MGQNAFLRGRSQFKLFRGHEMEYSTIISIVLFISLVVSTYLVILSSRDNKVLWKFARRNTFTYLEHVKNPDELSRLIDVVRSLSGAEVEIILQKIFGRQIRVVKSIDEFGQTQLEGVSILQSEEEPVIKQLNELLNESFKGKHSPIG